MKLTQVKVRGKRGQPCPNKRPKNKLKGKEIDMDGLPETKRAKKLHEKGHGSRVKKRRLSRLSQLPLEILERIFIASRNLSLPLVNRELYDRLSADSTKHQLVGAAFGPTWDTWYGLDNFEVSSYDGWQSDPDRIEGDSRFQTAILACSWAKLPILLSAFDVWVRKHARGRAYFTIPELKEKRGEFAPQPASLYDCAYNAGDGNETSPTMTMRTKFAFDLTRFQDRLGCKPSGISAGHIPSEYNSYYFRALLGMHLEVHPGTMVPDDLLSGPFEAEDGGLEMGQEKMCRLFWLVRGGACLQNDQAWEATQEGFRCILQLVEGRKADYEDGSDPTNSISCPSTSSRLELAARLFALFDILGVFDEQWPWFVVLTTLTHVSAMIARTTADSPEEGLLGDIAAELRHILPLQGDAQAVSAFTLCGGRWRRPDKWGVAKTCYPRSLNLVCSRAVRVERERLFLLALDGGEHNLPAATGGATGSGFVIN